MRKHMLVALLAVALVWTSVAKASEPQIQKLPDLDGMPRARIVTDHYDIYYERYDPSYIGQMMESAYDTWTEFWCGKHPPHHRRLLVRMYGSIASMKAGAKEYRHNAPVVGNNMGQYWIRTKTAFAYALDGPGAMQYEMLHECLHQFHYLAASDNRNPMGGWYYEGMATWAGNSRWDGTTFLLGGGHAVPRGDRPATLKGICSGGYDGFATIVSFLATQYPIQFITLRDALDKRTKLPRAWQTSFGWTTVPKGFIDEFDTWCQNNYRLPHWESWDAHIEDRAMIAAINLTSYLLATDKIESLNYIRRRLKSNIYGNPIDTRTLGKDLKRLLRDLARVRHPLVRTCSLHIVEAYNRLKLLEKKDSQKGHRHAG